MAGPDYERPKIRPLSPSDIPEGEHFGILTPQSTHVPGDERSRTNPGHGYPEHTVESWSYEIYENREKWEQAIRYMTFHDRKFVPIHANRPKVDRVISVEIAKTKKPS